MHFEQRLHDSVLAAASVQRQENQIEARITSYNVCYTKLLRYPWCGLTGCAVAQYECEGRGCRNQQDE